MPSQFRSFADKSPAWLTVLSIAASCLTAQQSYAQERAPKILIAANNNSDAALGLQLYNHRAYGPATEAFERAIRTSTPEPNLYYYAALANRGSLHEARAKQLFQYIVTNFPQSVQASYAKTALAAQVPSGGSSTGGSWTSSPPASPAAPTVELPETVKAALSPEMRAMLNTPGGQQAVQEALKQNADKVQSITQSRAASHDSTRPLGPAVSVAQICDSTAPNQIKILFIGNSFTSTYQLPAKFADLCGKTEKLKITEVICTEASKVTAGGFTLEDHWNAGQALNTIKSGPWDYVVIQDSSIRPISEPSKSLETIERFDKEIRKVGAKTVLYETWANQNEQGRQDALNHTYHTAANDTRAILVPAGEAWHALIENHPEINLYGPDTHHPSEEGVYLTACVFYAKLLHKNPADLGTSSGSIPPTVATILRKQAWETGRF